MGGVSKIFIIKGSTGEFDSYHTWNVSCYQDYTIASIVARHAQDEADRIFNNLIRSKP